MCEHTVHCLQGKPMLSPSKPHNHVVPLTAPSAKLAILLSAPKFDTGANTFFIVFPGEGGSSFYTAQTSIVFFFLLFSLTLPFSSFLYFLPLESEALTFKTLQKAYQPSPCTLLQLSLKSFSTLLYPAPSETLWQLIVSTELSRETHSHSLTLTLPHTVRRQTSAFFCIFENNCIYTNPQSSNSIWSINLSTCPPKSY